MEIAYHLNDIKAAAKKVWENSKDYKVWAFHAEMGAGKTTFIHAVCEILGVTSTIGSPTYSIINQYATSAGGTVYHMDWYRLKDEEEALQAGVEDALFSGELCLVEWPEKAEKLLPDKTVHLFISVVDIQTRNIQVMQAANAVAVTT